MNEASSGGAVHSLIGSVQVSSASPTADPALLALDLATGNRNWGSLFPEHLDGQEVPDDYSPLEPAVTASRGYTALNLIDPDRAALFAVDLATGQVRWTQRLEGAVTALAVADGQFLVSTQSSHPDSNLPHGKVVGFDTGDGRERWRIEFDAYVQRFVVCDGAVYAALSDTQIVSLR